MDGIRSKKVPLVLIELCSVPLLGLKHSINELVASNSNTLQNITRCLG